MPKIKNKRYLTHFKKGKIETMASDEFYEKLARVKGKYHIENLLKDYFLLLYWTGRRPVEILDLIGEDFRQTSLKEKDGSKRDYLAIQTHTKKGGKPVEIFLVFEQIPQLKELWTRIQGIPADFPVFGLLRSRSKQKVSWKTKELELIINGQVGIKPSKLKEKEYDKPEKNIFYWCVKYFGVPPYFFRHNRFSLMKQEGASFEDIKTFKGAKTMASVEPYINPTEEKLRELGRKLSYKN